MEKEEQERWELKYGSGPGVFISEYQKKPQ